MIFDWDLWPWMIAEHADDSGLSLETRRITQNLLRVQRAVGIALYPAMRNLANFVRENS